MLEFAIASQNLPFAIVFGLLIAIMVIEILGLLVGANLGSLLGEIDLPEIPEVDIDVDLPTPSINPGVVTSFLYWLNIGRVPVIILLVVFMTAFTVCGYVLQYLAFSLGGFLFPWYLATLVAVVGAVPLVRAFGRSIARYIPKDETEAVSTQELVGTRAIITIGKAKKGYPAQARTSDRYGTTHYVMVEPDDPEMVLDSKMELLLVRQSGNLFYAIAHPEP